MWQCPNGAIHIKQTPVTLKKQQRSFCLSFILCSSSVVRLSASFPPQQEAAAGSRPFDHPMNAIHKKYIQERKKKKRPAPPPDLCEAA